MGIEDGVHNRNGCSLSNGFGLSPTKRKKKVFFFLPFVDRKIKRKIKAVEERHGRGGLISPLWDSSSVRREGAFSRESARVHTQGDGRRDDWTFSCIVRFHRSRTSVSTAPVYTLIFYFWNRICWRILPFFFLKSASTLRPDYLLLLDCLRSSDKECPCWNKFQVSLMVYIWQLSGYLFLFGLKTRSNLAP